MFKIAQRCYAPPTIERASPSNRAASMTLRTFAIALALLAAPPALAQNLASFVVANDDGYGVDTCLTSGAACGQPVATAWCVANGYQRSIDFRPQTAADMTGDIAGPTRIAAREPSAVVITCEK
jgi:hypothetical protein